MSKTKSAIIRPLMRFILKIGGRNFLRRIGIDETKAADFIVKQVLGDDEIYDVQGFKLKRGRTTRIPILTGEIDPAITLLIKKNVRPGMNVFDLGANFGWFSLIFSKLVGSSGHVYAFEADPTLIKTINDNVKLNNLDNVTVIPKAISNKSQVGEFSLNETYDTRSQLGAKSPKGKIIKIETISLDEFCDENNIKQVDFIKMDIEGSEPKAIEGMKKIISSNPNLKIITEFNQNAIVSVESSPEQFIELLDEMGLDFKGIDEEKPGNLNIVSKEDVLSKQVCNLFCYKDKS